MIIISQDKNKMINIDNITQIYITEDEEKTAYFIRVETTFEAYEDLGNYITEERAKEVFKEIVKCYSCSEQLKCVVHINGCLNATELNNLAATSFIYEMPEE